MTVLAPDPDAERELAGRKLRDRREVPRKRNRGFRITARLIDRRKEPNAGASHARDLSCARPLISGCTIGGIVDELEQPGRRVRARGSPLKPRETFLLQVADPPGWGDQSRSVSAQGRPGGGGLGQSMNRGIVVQVKADELVGTWRLRSWKNVASDGSSVDPLGEAPVGYLFYNHDGYMSVEMMAAHRVPYHVADAFGGTSEERSEAITTYLSYSGPFEVLADRDVVIHHIEVCSFPNWIGNAQVRFAKLDGNQLTLSTKPMRFQGVERTAHVVWERIGQD